MEESGIMQVSPGSVVNWEARNQVTKAVSSISLPKVMIGGTWLGQIRDTEMQVPVVDSVRRITKATSTIFQRMNRQGDMLRVATNVIGDDGKRAIGTFIPAEGRMGSRIR